MDTPTAVVLRAWKDESFRNSLTEEQRAAIPPKPENRRMDDNTSLLRQRRDRLGDQGHRRQPRHGLTTRARVVRSPASPLAPTGLDPAGQGEREGMAIVDVVGDVGTRPSPGMAPSAGRSHAHPGALHGSRDPSSRTTHEEALANLRGLAPASILCAPVNGRFARAGSLCRELEQRVAPGAACS